MNLQNMIDYCKNNNLPSPLSGVRVPDPIDADTVRSYIMLRCGLMTPLYLEPEVFTMATKIWFDAHQWNFDHLVKMILAEYSPIENVDRYDSQTTISDGSGNKTNTGMSQDTHSGNDVNTTLNENTRTHSGTDTTTEAVSGSNENTERHSGSDVISESDDTNNKVSAYNSTTYQPDSQIVSDKETTTEYGEVIANAGSKTETVNSSILHGETIGDSGSNTQTTAHGHVIDNTHNDTENTTDHNETVFTQHLHGNVGVTSNQDLMTQEQELLKNFNVYSWIAERFEEENFIMTY